MIVEPVKLKTAIDSSRLVTAWHSIERTIEQNAPLWSSFPLHLGAGLGGSGSSRKEPKGSVHPHRSLHLFPKAKHDE